MQLIHDDPTAAEERLDERLNRLARLLHNPNLDRCDIADGVLGDLDLIDFLGGYKSVILEKVVIPQAHWSECIGDDYGVAFSGMKVRQPSDQFVMPMLLGCLVDDCGRPWFQSSAHEFVPAIEGIRTSNFYGPPVFRACWKGSMSTSFISAN